jgi:hypothetical protein
MKANKTICSLVLIFFSFFVLSCKGQKVEKIIIHYVKLDIETSFRVSCDNFENFFSDGYKTVVIKDNNKLKEFSNYLSHSDVSDSTKKIDVRVKIIVTYANKKNSFICMDRFYNLLLDNKSITANQNIIAFIKKQINK